MRSPTAASVLMLALQWRRRPSAACSRRSPVHMAMTSIQLRLQIEIKSKQLKKAWDKVVKARNDRDGWTLACAAHVFN